jgi:hypothetical protein
LAPDIAKLGPYHSVHLNICFLMALALLFILNKNVINSVTRFVNLSPFWQFLVHFGYCFVNKIAKDFGSFSVFLFGSKFNQYK